MVWVLKNGCFDAESAKADFRRMPSLQFEFQSEDVFVAFARAVFFDFAYRGGGGQLDPHLKNVWIAQYESDPELRADFETVAHWIAFSRAYRQQPALH